MIRSDLATIFVVEDNATICRSLRWLFESVNMQVETFNTARDYLAAHNPNRYGCLLIDIRLPDMSGLQLQEELVKRHNPLPIIIITGHGDVTLAVRAMRMGAKNFILKPFNNDLLLEEIQKILTESHEQQVMHQQFTNGFSKLTAREREVMQLIVMGKLNKQIAAKCKISVSTVEQHRAHIMQKMRMKTLADLIKAHLLLTHLYENYANTACR